MAAIPDAEGPGDAAPGGRRWRRRRWGAGAAEPLYAGVGERVETILRLAEQEASDLRAEARAAAAAVLEAAERDAARIRTEAEEYARGLRERSSDPS